VGLVGVDQRPAAQVGLRNTCHRHERPFNRGLRNAFLCSASQDITPKCGGGRVRFLFSLSSSCYINFKEIVPQWTFSRRAGGRPSFDFSKRLNELGCPSIRAKALSRHSSPLRCASTAEARIPLYDQTATHLSRKARERWGTRFIVIRADWWATRPEEIRKVFADFRSICANRAHNENLERLLGSSLGEPTHGPCQPAELALQQSEMR
jgi:hypothetical protein